MGEPPHWPRLTFSNSQTNSMEAELTKLKGNFAALVVSNWARDDYVDKELDKQHTRLDRHHKDLGTNHKNFRGQVTAMEQMQDDIADGLVKVGECNAEYDLTSDTLFPD